MSEGILVVSRYSKCSHLLNGRCSIKEKNRTPVSSSAGAKVLVYFVVLRFHLTVVSAYKIQDTLLGRERMTQHGNHERATEITESARKLSDSPYSCLQYRDLTVFLTSAHRPCTDYLMSGLLAGSVACGIHPLRTDTSVKSPSRQT